MKFDFELASGAAMGEEHFGAWAVLSWQVFLACLGGAFLKMSVAHSTVEDVFY